MSCYEPLTRPLLKCRQSLQTRLRSAALCVGGWRQPACGRGRETGLHAVTDRRRDAAQTASAVLAHRLLHTAAARRPRLLRAARWMPAAGAARSTGGRAGTAGRGAGRRAEADPAMPVTAARQDSSRRRRSVTADVRRARHGSTPRLGVFITFTTNQFQRRGGRRTTSWRRWNDWSTWKRDSVETKKWVTGARLAEGKEFTPNIEKVWKAENGLREIPDFFCLKKSMFSYIIRNFKSSKYTYLKVDFVNKLKMHYGLTNFVWSLQFFTAGGAVHCSASRNTTFVAIINEDLLSKSTAIHHCIVWATVSEQRSLIAALETAVCMRMELSVKTRSLTSDSSDTWRTNTSTHL